MKLVYDFHNQNKSDDEWWWHLQNCTGLKLNGAHMIRRNVPVLLDIFEILSPR